jgi:hypothetical protein
MWHYVYRLENIDTGEFYIGSRSCENHPTMDKYFGSMLTWKVNKKMLKKVILEDNFSSREECILFERSLILEVIDDSLNRNYHVPGDGFHTVGSIPVIDLESNKKIRVPKEDYLLNKDKYRLIWEGRKHSDESRDKMRQSALNRVIDEEVEMKRRESISKTLTGHKRTEEFKNNLSKSRKGPLNPMYGKTSSQKGKVYERVVCPHCNKEIAKTKANLFHFDKCKLN